MAIRNPVNSNYTVTDGTVYWDGTRILTTATGTAGQILTSNGATAPTYQTVSSGTATMMLVQTQAAGQFVNFTTGITAGHNYLLTYRGLLVGSTTPTHPPVIQFSTDGGSTYLATGYNSENNLYRVSPVGWSPATGSVNGIQLVQSGTLASGQECCGHTWLYGLGTASYPSAISNSVYLVSVYSFITGTYFSSQITVNAFRINSTQNVFTGGTFSLYKIAT